MKREEVQTENAPKAVGPYSQAVIAGDVIYCSGQIGLDPKTNTVVQNGIAEETKQVLENLKHVLEAAGANLKNVVRTDIFLTDINNFAIVNEIYATYFTEKPLPARQTVAVSKLPKNAQVEMSCVAYIKK